MQRAPHAQPEMPAHHTAEASLLLAFEHVTKFYGPVIGVNNISCRIGPGITGLFGANGAGKIDADQAGQRTTAAQSGDGADRRPRGLEHGRQASLRLQPGREQLLRGDDRLRVRVHDGPAVRLHAHRGPRADRLRAGRSGHVGSGHRRLAGCSHGMRQRIKLAQALVHDPWLLLLDEPLTGIDPGGRREINELLVRQAAQGKTILVSSHILVEIEHLADSILMMSRGRIVASGTLAEIRALMKYRPMMVEIVAEPARRLAALLAEYRDVQAVEVRDSSLVVRTRNPAEFFAYLGDLVCDARDSIGRMQTLDSGADAVFDYLQQGRP